MHWTRFQYSARQLTALPGPSLPVGVEPQSQFEIRAQGLHLSLLSGNITLSYMWSFQIPRNLMEHFRALMYSSFSSFSFEVFDQSIVFSTVIHYFRQPGISTWPLILFNKCFLGKGFSHLVNPKSGQIKIALLMGSYTEAPEGPNNNSLCIQRMRL